MAGANQLYDVWSRDSELRGTLSRSLEPRGTEWLFELFASLAPKRGDVVLDVGCRDAQHTVRLAREHGLRGYAVDPLPLHVEQARATIEAAGVDLTVLEAPIEELPLEDDSVDWIWCRDVLGHTDVQRGLAECARVLRPRGCMLAYVTLATDRLEPRERELLVESLALKTFDAESVETAAAAAGLAQLQAEPLRGEWRERMLEDGTWTANESLLAISRLDRRRDELVAAFGESAVDAALGGELWGIYQLLGKTCPTVYVWERRG